MNDRTTRPLGSARQDSPRERPRTMGRRVRPPGWSETAKAGRILTRPVHRGERVIVTGGAGFIGSHLVDRLLDAGADVTVFDNLTSGNMRYLKGAEGRDGFTFVNGDVKDLDHLIQVMDGASAVYHLAANPDVRLGARDSKVHVNENIVATHVVLEAMRHVGVPLLVFTSTSTVYGEAKTIPTPEDHGPLEPISLYGASKLAAEALISSYCGTFDMAAVTYRFANIVGPRSNHGVTFDFYHKLVKNPGELEILGDGRQLKSYCHVHDCVDAMLHGVQHRKNRYECYNIGSADAIDVFAIAKAVIAEMGLKDVVLKTTGGVDGGRGWKGDVKLMRLAIDRLQKSGWEPKFASEAAIRDTTKALIADHGGEA